MSNKWLKPKGYKGCKNCMHQPEQPYEACKWLVEQKIIIVCPKWEKKGGAKMDGKQVE